MTFDPAKQHYSGDHSIPFWDAVNAHSNQAIYEMGCDLQALESMVLRMLATKSHAPEPVGVDWGQPVRWVDSKAPLEIVGKCLKKDGTENLIVKWVYDDAEHAMEITPSVDFVAVENVPPKTLTAIAQQLFDACKDVESKIVDYEAKRINWRPDDFLQRVREAMAEFQSVELRLGE